MKTAAEKPDAVLRTPEQGQFVRGLGRLVRSELVPPPPPPPPVTDYIFEEITARWEVRAGGDVLQVKSTLWDFYGEGTSVSETLAEAKGYAKAKGFGPGSSVEVVAIKIVTQVRKRMTDSPHPYTEGVAGFQPSPYPSRGLPPPQESVVWSSQHDL